MSSVLIVSSIVAGLFVLMVIVYANHMLEASKLEKARQRADLSDRIKRCGSLAETLPGQFAPASLKLLLARIRLSLAQRLLPLEKQNDELSKLIAELKTVVEAGESAIASNPPQPMASEAKVKDLRFQFEALHGQLGRAAQDGLITQAEAKRWVQEIRKMLVLSNSELFENAGRLALQQKQPRQARLAFERGLQYLRKQPDQTQYKPQIERLHEMLESTEQMVRALDEPQTEAASELTEGLDAINEDGRKKKNMYD